MRPLEGLRILDLSRLVAGGMTGMLLADFGAEVVKVEQPGVGDPLRTWTTGGLPLWWKVYGRNKTCITLNIRSPEGMEIFKTLLPTFDVLIDSFVPGTLERWGLDWDTLHAIHPGLIWLRISGWGQTGPGSERPGFGTLVEAATGFAANNGEPDGPPILPSFPMGDMVTALYAVNALMFAVYHRDTHDGGGQVIDASLFESLFSLLGPIPAEYAATGQIRTRQGSRSKNSAPRGVYSTADGGWIAVSASTPKMAETFLESYGLGHLLKEERFATNEARVAHAVELDEWVTAAIASRTLAENIAIIDQNKLTAVPVQTIADIERDPHWQARQLIVQAGDEPHAVRMHNAIPHFSDTPGEIRWPGRELGADSETFYRANLGLSPEEVENLRAKGVV